MACSCNIPMERPYCSCKQLTRVQLTRVRTASRGPTLAASAPGPSAGRCGAPCYSMCMLCIVCACVCVCVCVQLLLSVVYVLRVCTCMFLICLGSRTFYGEVTTTYSPPYGRCKLANLAGRSQERWGVERHPVQTEMYHGAVQIYTCRCVKSMR